MFFNVKVMWLIQEVVVALKMLVGFDIPIFMKLMFFSLIRITHPTLTLTLSSLKTALVPSKTMIGRFHYSYLVLKGLLGVILSNVEISFFLLSEIGELAASSSKSDKYGRGSSDAYYNYLLTRRSTLKLKTPQCDITLLRDLSQHKPISNEGNKPKNCVYCLFNKTKTKSGWRVLTRHRCSVCGVSLCTARGCFHSYHAEICSALGALGGDS